MTTIFCPSCGTQLPPTMRFCTNCGTAIDFAIHDKPTSLSKGEKLYLVLVGVALGIEAIVYASTGSGGIFNPLYALAPILLGYYKHEGFSGMGPFSSTFRQYLIFYLIIILGLFIWEARPGDPLRDALLIFLGPILFLMFLMGAFILNFVMYLVGHFLHNIFNRG